MSKGSNVRRQPVTEGNITALLVILSLTIAGNVGDGAQDCGLFRMQLGNGKDNCSPNALLTNYNCRLDRAINWPVNTGNNCPGQTGLSLISPNTSVTY